MGIVLWLITPWRPSGLTPQAWEMFAIFVATIVGMYNKAAPNWWYHAFRDGCNCLGWNCSS